jgi:hypothetical protein
MYLITHPCFVYALMMFSNSMRKIKTDRNMSNELLQIMCKKRVKQALYRPGVAQRVPGS